jgi:chromate transporter
VVIAIIAHALFGLLRTVIKAMWLGGVAIAALATYLLGVNELLILAAGALLAAVAIFVPSFVFVGLLTKITDKLRSTAWTSALLDGLNATALALMAGVSYQLARTAIVDLLTAVIAVIALVLLWKTKVNNAWLIAGGAAIGLLHTLLT